VTAYKQENANETDVIRATGGSRFTQKLMHYCMRTMTPNCFINFY